MYRKISTAAGVTASVAPASSPAAAPSRGSDTARRTVAYSAATVPTPISACGASTAHGFIPNSRTDSPVTHVAAGGLSTVTKFPASSDPKNHAFQLCAPAWAAAA